MTLFRFGKSDSIKIRLRSMCGGDFYDEKIFENIFKFAKNCKKIANCGLKNST